MTYSFPNFEPVNCSMSSSNCCILSCIQVSQETGKVAWYSHVFKNFLHFVIRTVKAFSIVNEAEVDVFLEFSCFLYDPTNVGNLVSGSSAFSKPSLYIWKFLAHVLLKVKVVQLCLTLCDFMDYIIHGILQARILEWVAFPFSRVSSQPRIEPRSPSLQADSLPAEPQGKPKHTGVGSLSLLQQIFLTQESNHSLLHCRQVLYQLNYQGSLA